MRKSNQSIIKTSVATYLTLPILLTSCSNAAVEPIPSKKKQHMLLTDSISPTLPAKTAPKIPALSHKVTPSISGQWRMGFKVRDKTASSILTFNQSGNSFQGEGQEDQTGVRFKIENGKIDGSQISFSEQYEGSNRPPIQFNGQFSVLKEVSPGYQGSYISGQYSANGGNLNGPWEAAMVADNAANESAPASPPTQNSESSPPQSSTQSQPEKAPQLSGKWNVGYEYDFKTIHSTMYLEQTDKHIVGHGVDEETKEKFQIVKGWYNYPHLTLVRRYTKGAGAKSNKDMTFKADVSYVNEEDYQGPYLNGKTQGGGTWEAQLVK